MEYKEKLYFGKGVWVDIQGLLPAIGRHLGRPLLQDEINCLYRIINASFREEFAARKDQWCQWIRENDETTFDVYLKIHSAEFLSGVQNLKNVLVSIRKNIQRELRLDAICPDYIALVGYGNVKRLRSGQKSICDFKVDGRVLRYRKFAFDNLFIVLKKIGKVKCSKEEGWADVVNRNLWQSYEAIPESGKCGEFLVDTGMNLRPDEFDEYSPWSPISLMFKETESEEWDIKIVIANDIEHAVRIEDCIPSIYKRIDRRMLKDVAIRELARVADCEDWSYKDNPYGSLLYYLESVYERLEQESSAGDRGAFAVPKDDKSALVFCTGLVTPDSEGAHYIYAYCSSPDENGVYQQIEWLTHSGSRKQGICYNQKLVFDNDHINHGLPYPPHWVSAPERLLFDYRFGSINEGQIEFLFPHIFENLKTRLPEPLRKRFCLRFPDCNDVAFREYLYAAWRTTRKILQKSFKVAIPTYYRGKIQLLVPLYLDESEKGCASVALVVTLNEKKGIGASHYFCPTCLSLDMARMDSRVITRVDDTWLSIRK